MLFGNETNLCSSHHIVKIVDRRNVWDAMSHLFKNYRRREIVGIEFLWKMGTRSNTFKIFKFVECSQ